MRSGTAGRTTGACRRLGRRTGHPIQDPSGIGGQHQRRNASLQDILGRNAFWRIRKVTATRGSAQHRPALQLRRAPAAPAPGASPRPCPSDGSISTGLCWRRAGLPASPSADPSPPWPTPRLYRPRRRPAGRTATSASPAAPPSLPGGRAELSLSARSGAAASRPAGAAYHRKRRAREERLRCRAGLRRFSSPRAFRDGRLCRCPRVARGAADIGEVRDRGARIQSRAQETKAQKLLGRSTVKTNAPI